MIVETIDNHWTGSSTRVTTVPVEEEEGTRLMVTTPFRVEDGFAVEHSWSLHFRGESNGRETFHEQ
jgi:hypothetical protein